MLDRCDQLAAGDRGAYEPTNPRKGPDAGRCTTTHSAVTSHATRSQIADRCSAMVPPHRTAAAYCSPESPRSRPRLDCARTQAGTTSPTTSHTGSNTYQAAHPATRSTTAPEHRTPTSTRHGPSNTFAGCHHPARVGTIRYRRISLILSRTQRTPRSTSTPPNAFMLQWHQRRAFSASVFRVLPISFVSRITCAALGGACHRRHVHDPAESQPTVAGSALPCISLLLRSSRCRIPTQQEQRITPSPPALLRRRQPPTMIRIGQHLRQGPNPAPVAATGAEAQNGGPCGRLQMLGGAFADGGAQGVEFGEHTGGGPDLVALTLGQHLEHPGRGKPAQRAIRARIGGAGDPLGRVGAEDRGTEEGIDDLLVGGVAARPRDIPPIAGEFGQGAGGVLRGLAGDDRRMGDVLDAGGIFLDRRDPGGWKVALPTAPEASLLHHRQSFWIMAGCALGRLSCSHPCRAAGLVSCNGQTCCTSGLIRMTTADSITSGHRHSTLSTEGFRDGSDAPKRIGRVAGPLPVGSISEIHRSQCAPYGTRGSGELSGR